MESRAQLRQKSNEYTCFIQLGGTFELSLTLSMQECVNCPIEKISKVLSASSVKSVWGNDRQGSQILTKLSSTRQALDTLWMPQ